MTMSFTKTDTTGATGAAAEDRHSDSVRTLIDAWKLMVGRFPGNSISQADGLAAIYANREIAFFNFTVFDSPLADLEAVRQGFRRARTRAAQCPHPSMLAFAQDWMAPGWQAVAAEEGVVPAMNMVAMVADDILPPRRPPPALTYRVIADPASARDIMMVNAHAYGYPEDLFETVSGMDLWQENGWGVVGYADGRAVCSTATFLLDDMIYVAMVATEPDCHGKGYADAVMRHAIHLAQEKGGAKPIWLHATDMGRPVYAAMGFSPCATTPVYSFETLPA